MFIKKDFKDKATPAFRENRASSVVDVIEILSEQSTHDGTRKYWSVVKTRLKQEGAELTTIYSQLKMLAYDGKYYNIIKPTKSTNRRNH